MGRRNYFGFKRNGLYYMIYCHWGHDRSVREVYNAVVDGSIADWPERFDNLIKVNSDTPVTQQDINQLRPYTDVEVDINPRQTPSWYQLTHKCQGSFTAILNSGYILASGKDIPYNPEEEDIEFYEFVDLDQMRYGCGCGLVNQWSVPLTEKDMRTVWH